MAEVTQQKIQSAGTGATVKGIKASLLKKIHINFPKDLQEQNNRVQILDDISTRGNSLIKTLRKKYDELTLLKSAVLKQELQSSEAA